MRSRGDLTEIFKCVERVTRHRKMKFVPDGNFIKQETEYRKKQVYGDKTVH